MKIHWPQPNRRFAFFDVLGLFGLLGFFVARFIPVARLPFWGCALRHTTGWPCPSCGLTRVADRLAHGNFAGAWDSNPLGTVAALILGAVTLASILHLAFRVPVPEVELSKREAFLLRAAIVLLVAVNYAYLIVKAKFPWLL